MVATSTAYMIGTTVSTCIVKPIVATSRLRQNPLAIRTFSRLPVYPDRISRAILCIKLLVLDKYIFKMPRRKIYSNLAQERPLTTIPIPVTPFDDSLPTKQRASQRRASHAKPQPAPANPDKNLNVLDGTEAIRASPDAEELDERLKGGGIGKDGESHVEKEHRDEDESDSSLSDPPNIASPVQAGRFKSKPAGRVGIKSRIADKSTEVQTGVQATTTKQQSAGGHQFLDPEAEGDEEADEEEIQAALSRPPPANSDYLPLPWKGRLGYVRHDIFAASFAKFNPGLFMYVSTLFKSAGLQLSNLPHCIHLRKSTPAQRSQWTPAPNKEQTR